MSKLSSWVLLAFIAFFGWKNALLAQRPASESELARLKSMLESAKSWDEIEDSLQVFDPKLSKFSIGEFRALLWEKYQQFAKQDTHYLQNFSQGRIAYAPGKVGQFFMTKVGEKPEKGYPVYIALHGGGGGPKEMNDSQWEIMQRYYLKSISNGIYVAPRGPNNTWNLHFDEDAMAFYAELIKGLKLLEGADPDRIYLLGYSAGGDGVYQLAPRFTSWLAAASMSAGHHNGVSPVNLNDLPMLQQVGEMDSFYNRNKETVRYGLWMDSLSEKYKGGYLNEVYVHAGKGHSFVQDRQGAAHEANVVADPYAWLGDSTGRMTKMAQTDAVTWLGQYRRSVLHEHLIWDLGTQASESPWHYWLSSDEKEGMAEAIWKFGSNRIHIFQMPSTLRIGFHELMFEDEQAILIGNHVLVWRVFPFPRLSTMVATMRENHDPSQCFSMVLDMRLSKDGKMRLKAEKAGNRE